MIKPVRLKGSPEHVKSVLPADTVILDLGDSGIDAGELDKELEKRLGKIISRRAGEVNGVTVVGSEAVVCLKRGMKKAKEKAVLVETARLVSDKLGASRG
jgi:hypothetical protein